MDSLAVMENNKPRIGEPLQGPCGPLQQFGRKTVEMWIHHFAADFSVI